jgi:hypothetical protein
MMNPNETQLGESFDIDSLFEPKPQERPVYIDDLPDAVEIDMENRVAWFKPKPGEQVVIEKWHKGRWMGTSLYTVRSVNVKTGDVALHDDENQQAAMANYVHGPLKHGWRFKLPIPRLNLNRREAPPMPTEPAQKPTFSENGDLLPSPPKKRGRPKGSKNRSPEVVAAEIAKKVQATKAKRAARALRKK